MKEAAIQDVEYHRQLIEGCCAISMEDWHERHECDKHHILLICSKHV